MRIISQKLRDIAKGQDFTLRLDGCLYEPSTVVLAHLPCGQKGAGMKGPDIIAAFACQNCHSIIDGPNRWEVPAADYLRAVAETQLRWVEMGLIQIKGLKK